ncbi:MAG: hypothetical protein WA304_05685, partial [Candidatus Cybelea sp.]
MARQYDDDFYYPDYDDYDPADRALRDQIDEDAELVRKVQIHLFTHTMRESPLPGTSVGDDFRKRFSLQFPPLPPMDTNGGLVDELRNLFDDDSYEDAKKRARSENPNEAWFGAMFLFQRNEAFGRYCANVNCLGELPEEPRRRGRPRLYHRPGDKAAKSRDCKDAAIKRRKYHEANPNTSYRTRAMLVPGIPFSLRDRSGSSTYYRNFIPPRTNYTAPWLKESDDRQTDDRPAELSQHVSQWLRRHGKKRKVVPARRKGRTTKQKRQRQEFAAAFGLPLEELVQRAFADGCIFGDEDRAAIEEVLGRSINSLITGEDDEDDDD